MGKERKILENSNILATKEALGELSKELLVGKIEGTHITHIQKGDRIIDYKQPVNVLTHIFKNTENNKYLIINTNQDKIVDFFTFDKLTSRYICGLIPHQIRGNGLSFSLENYSVLTSQKINLRYENFLMNIQTNNSPKIKLPKTDTTILNIVSEIRNMKWDNVRVFSIQ